MDWHKPGAPQQLLASVSQGVQRFAQQLQAHRLDAQPLKGSSAQPHAPHRTQYGGCKSHQVVVEDEGVLTPLQVRSNMHRGAAVLGAALLAKLGRVGNRLKDHHTKMKEEGEARKAARRERREGELNPLRLALPWHRKRRRGPHNEGHIFRLGGPRATAYALVQKGREHEREMDVRAAVRCYEDANTLVPNDMDTLCLAAKAWSDVCYLDEISGAARESLAAQDKQAVNQRAMQYAQQAMRVSPLRALPHVACCISMGRLAVFSDNKTKVKLVKDARKQAVIALQKEPDNDLAQHLMGRWHSEMANLNSIVRTLIRLMYGAELPAGTHREALEHYRAASRLAPSRLVHRVELGRTLWRLGERKSALAELEAAVALDVEDINAHLQKVDAELLVKDLRRSVKRRAPPRPPAPATPAAEPAQPPRKWRLPQLPNPFAAKEASPEAGPAATGEKQPSSWMHRPGAPPVQQAGGACRLPWADKPSPSPVPAAGSAAAGGKTGNLHEALSEKLSALKNPFQQWGRKVAPC